MITQPHHQGTLRRAVGARPDRLMRPRPHTKPRPDPRIPTIPGTRARAWPATHPQGISAQNAQVRTVRLLTGI